MFENYPDMITIDDMCEMLSIGKNTAYELLNSNQVHAFRIGRIWKIPKESISEYIMRCSNLQPINTPIVQEKPTRKTKQSKVKKLSPFNIEQ